MKFEKIIIPPGWQESFTKYPNGKTIFEALSHTITTVNEGIEEVNQKVNQGLLSIEQAETIRNEITDSFNTLKLELESGIGDLSGDLFSQCASFQLSVNAQLAEKANQATTYTKTEVDNALELKANKNQEAWITPTLLNNWIPFNADLSPGYMKDSLGFVHLKGVLKAGITGQDAFYLPIGYRPDKNRFLIGCGDNSFGLLTILSGGQVQPTAPGGTGFRSLDGITFKAGV